MGTGNIISYENGAKGINSEGKEVSTLKFLISCKDAADIIIDKNDDEIEINFALEKYLEEFIVDNWQRSV